MTTKIAEIVKIVETATSPIVSSLDSSLAEKLSTGSRVEMIFDPVEGLSVTIDDLRLDTREFHIVATNKQNVGCEVRLRCMQKFGSVTRWVDYYITNPAIFATLKVNEEE